MTPEIRRSWADAARMLVEGWDAIGAVGRPVGALARRVVPFDGGTPCAVIDEWFRSSPDRSAAVVVTPTGPTALPRARFYQSMVGPTGFGRALFYDKAVERVLDTSSLVVREDQPAAEAAKQLLDHGMFDDIVVRFADGTVGTVPAASVFMELAAEHRSAAAELRRSRARFAALADAVSDVVVVLAADTRIEYVSPSSAGTLGSNPESLVGMRLAELVHPEDRRVVQLALARLTTGVTPEVDLPIRVCTTVGATAHVRFRVRDRMSDPDVRGLVVSMTDVTAERRLAEELRHRAFHDALTGLPNRAYLLERIEEMLAGELDARRPSVLFIDLDGFKELNDRLGHAGGDVVLAGCARRLRGVLRDDATPARFGGDEFVVLLAPTAEPENAWSAAERIRRALVEPYEVDGLLVDVQCSIGLATFDGSCSAEELLRRADIALYDAKAAGKNCVRSWTVQLHERVRRTRAIRAALPRAVAGADLTLAYQPVVCVGTGEIEGVEALVRWNHAELGAVTPNEFIPIAEESELIVELGELVLREACATAVSWRSSSGAPLRLAVNVSALQLTQALAPAVRRILAETGFPASRLDLEITESAVARTPQLLDVLPELKAIGVRLAIDDFGTGYSSLAKLRRFPFDIVKLDRSFIEHLVVSEPDAVLVDGIVRLAHSLGLSVTAEGVETAPQLEQLGRSGCDRVQGYLLARPQPADEIAALLTGRRSVVHH